MGDAQAGRQGEARSCALRVRRSRASVDADQQEPARLAQGVSSGSSSTTKRSSICSNAPPSTGGLQSTREAREHLARLAGNLFILGKLLAEILTLCRDHSPTWFIRADVDQARRQDRERLSRRRHGDLGLGARLRSTRVTTSTTGSRVRPTRLPSPGPAPALWGEPGRGRRPCRGDGAAPQALP